MLRKTLPVLAATLLGLAACGDNGGDGVIQRDTTVTTVPRPDTLMVERTITVDTLRQPDVLPGDTVNRPDTLQ